MQFGEREHPLRADPLHTLPDAVRVPRPRSRRPRSAISSNSVPTSPPPSNDDTASLTQSDRTRLFSLAATSSDRRAFELEDLDHLRNANPQDPLRVALVQTVESRSDTHPGSPPAGHAFATDADSLLAQPHNPYAHPNDPFPADVPRLLSVPRVDITLLPAEAQEGSAAGVYVIETRPLSIVPSAHIPPSHVSHSPYSMSIAETSSSSSSSPSSSPSINSSPSSLPLQTPSYPVTRVRRSVADFNWLHGRLTSRYDGVIVPSLPAMSIAGRLAHGYAHDLARRRGLERFISRVARHPVLATGDEVPAFIGTAGERAWERIRLEPVITSETEHVTDALLEYEDGGINSANSRWRHWGEKLLWQTGKQINQGLVWLLDNRDQSGVEANENSAKARFQRLQMYVKDLGSSLSTLRDATARVAKERNSERLAARALHHEFEDLAKREGGKFASHFSTGMSHSVSFADEQAPSSNVDEPETLDDGILPGAGSLGGSNVAAKILDEILADYEERTKGAQSIMAARQEEQEAYERALAVYKKLRDRLESRTDVNSSENSVPHRGYVNNSSAENQTEANTNPDELARQVTAAATRLAHVRRHYQGIAVRTTDELRRLRADLHDDVRDGLELLAREIVREHTAQAATWERLADALASHRVSTMASAAQGP